MTPAGQDPSLFDTQDLAAMAVVGQILADDLALAAAGRARMDEARELSETAHARRTDPITSHEAAASITFDGSLLSRRRSAILVTLRAHGPMTDEQIADRYDGLPQSPSGLRTRRRELTDGGYVEDSGVKMTLRSGRRAIVWQIVEAPHRRRPVASTPPL